MDKTSFNENRIVDAIGALSEGEALGLLQEAVEGNLLVHVPKFRGYLCRELGEHLLRLRDGDEATPARQPGLREMDLDGLAQWTMGAALLNEKKVEGGIERLVDAIVFVAAANVTVMLEAAAATLRAVGAVLQVAATSLEAGTATHKAVSTAIKAARVTLEDVRTGGHVQ